MKRKKFKIRLIECDQCQQFIRCPHPNRHKRISHCSSHRCPESIRQRYQRPVDKAKIEQILAAGGLNEWIGRMIVKAVRAADRSVTIK